MMKKRGQRLSSIPCICVRMTYEWRIEELMHSFLLFHNEQIYENTESEYFSFL